MFRSFFSIDDALSQLLTVPISFAHDAPDLTGKGWFMHLDSSGSAGYKAYPGVYSTSFAIQLLSIDRKIADQNRILIVQGFDYLAQQFHDAETIERDINLANDCKQSHKLADVGHHDFVLTFKFCAILQAANSIAGIVDIGTEFADSLARHQQSLNRMAERLKRFAVSGQKGSTVQRAWPWHSLNPTAAEVDPVPTAEVLLTLTHPSLRNTPRWLSEHAEAAAYLQSVIRSEKTAALLLDKCIAAHALLQLTERTSLNYLEPSETQELTELIVKELRDPSNIPWQDVMHYSVPSKSTSTLSHYKPWIWLFPRIQYVETLSMLDRSAAEAPAAAAVAAVVSNISENQGKVIFVHAEPPALLASLRTAQLIIQVKATVLKSISGRIVMAYQQVARLSRGLNRFGYIGWLALLGVTVYTYATPFRSSLDGPAFQRTKMIIQEAASRLYSVWPIWLLLFLFLTFMSEGSFRKRVKTAILGLIMAVLISMLVNLLATWHPVS
jgi:hypothetical protein